MSLASLKGVTIEQKFKPLKIVILRCIHLPGNSSRESLLVADSNPVAENATSFSTASFEKCFLRHAQFWLLHFKPPPEFVLLFPFVFLSSFKNIIVQGCVFLYPLFSSCEVSGFRKFLNISVHGVGRGKGRKEKGTFKQRG